MIFMKIVKENMDKDQHALIMLSRFDNFQNIIRFKFTFVARKDDP